MNIKSIIIEKQKERLIQSLVQICSLIDKKNSKKNNEKRKNQIKFRGLWMQDFRRSLDILLEEDGISKRKEKWHWIRGKKERWITRGRIC